MTRVLFVCLGNICRSPMAECVLKDMVERRGLAGAFFIDSAATSDEELGNPIYPPARQKLREMGVPLTGHRARQMSRGDYQRFDLILGMERANIRGILRITGGDPEGKVRRLLDGTARPRDIADPWFTGNFDVTYDDILEGCRTLLAELGYEV